MELKLKLLDNEYWWGVSNTLGLKMPFGDYDFKGDTITLGQGNTASSVLLSNKGRYIYSSDNFEFEFKDRHLTVTDDNDKIINGQSGSTLKSAYMYVAKNFYSFNGKTPDEMMFKKAQYNTWIELIYNQNQKDVLKYAKSIIEHGMTPGVLMIDDNWQVDYGVWEFKKDSFPNPKEMVNELHSMGFKVMLWVCTFISPDCETFRIAEKQGYICKGTDGITKIKKWWNGYSAEIDFSNPDAVRWFKEKLDYLCDTYGIDGFKFDAGDIFPSLECEKPFYEYLKGYQTVGESFKFNEFRASFNAGGRALAQRECDKHHRWTNGGIEDLVPDGLAQGILGCPYNCADMIGGGEFTIFYENSDSGNSDVFDGEIIIRYAQAAALFPMMQYSFSPWRILKGHDLEYALEAEKIHLKFSDYIYECAKTASKTGEPIMRYLEYSYPNKGYEKITDEFLLGEDILVAPVYQKSVFRRKVQLPEGIWEADDGTVYGGNSEIEIDVPLSRLPYFIKQG